MADPIHLKVLTEAGVAIEESAVSIVAPGELGYLGILKNHAPLLTTVQRGSLTWRRSTGETKTVRIGEGFLEVMGNRVTLLTARITTAAPSTGEGRHA